MSPLALTKSAVSISYLAFSAIRTTPIPSCHSRLYPTQIGHLGWWTKVLGHCCFEDGLRRAADYHTPWSIERQCAGNAIGFLCGIVFRCACPTVGELANLFLSFRQRSAEETAAVCFGNEQIVGSVIDKGGGVVACIASFAKGLPVVELRVKPFVWVIGIVATSIADELTGGASSPVRHTDSAHFLGKEACRMSVLGHNVSESEAIIVDSEHDRQPPRSFFCRNGEYIAMVAIVAAFAYRKCVAVIDGAAVHFHQFDTFREVGRRDFQSEGRLVDEGSAVAGNGVGEFSVR